MRRWVRSHFEPEDDFCLSVFLRWVHTLFMLGLGLLILGIVTIFLLIYLPDNTWLINVLRGAFRIGAYAVTLIGIAWIILALWWRE